jgi:2-Cys peroxiredoxin 5
MSVIKVGDVLPAGKLTEKHPGDVVETATAFGKGKHIIFGVPGAFTPGSHPFLALALCALPSALCALPLLSGLFPLLSALCCSIQLLLPGCHKAHLPGYIADLEKYQAKGIESISCLSVNDTFVMQAWGAASGADSKVSGLCFSYFGHNLLHKQPSIPSAQLQPNSITLTRPCL